MEGVEILKAATLPDHVHMYVSIPPKQSVSEAVGRIKEKSALMIFDKHPEYRERYNRHFWARGYNCETVLNRLVNRILIGESKKVDGVKTQELRIVYNFVGEL